jgi:hypothetical protein
VPPGYRCDRRVLWVGRVADAHHHGMACRGTSAPGGQCSQAWLDEACPVLRYRRMQKGSKADRRIIALKGRVICGRSRSPNRTAIPPYRREALRAPDPPVFRYPGACRAAIIGQRSWPSERLRCLGRNDRAVRPNTPESAAQPAVQPAEHVEPGPHRVAAAAPALQRRSSVSVHDGNDLVRLLPALPGDWESSAGRHVQAAPARSPR